MNEITVFTFDEVIDAPIQFVYMCLNKDEHVSEWNEFIVENIYPNGNEDELAAGSKYQTVQKIDKKVITLEAEIIEFQPPFHAVLKTETKEGVSYTKYRLTEEAEGTRLHVESSLIPSNIKYKLLTKFMGWAVRFMYKDQYQSFVAYVHEHKDNIWEVDYASDDGEYFTMGKAVFQEDNSWKVYIDNGDSDTYTMLNEKGYKEGYYGVYLFDSASLTEAKEAFWTWADDVWKPMLAEKYFKEEAE